MKLGYAYTVKTIRQNLTCMASINLSVQARARSSDREAQSAQAYLLLNDTFSRKIISLFYEILAGVWVRNGLQIKGQAMTYIQANFCNSMVDMDIYWLQICAAHLPADQFIDMCIDMFGVREWLSMLPMTPAQAAEQDAMVEGLLTFLAILVSSRTNLGNDELTQSRLEVSTLLAAGDKTHSQLLELMPERSGNAHTRNFETVLKEPDPSSGLGCAYMDHYVSQSPLSFHQEDRSKDNVCMLLVADDLYRRHRVWGCEILRRPQAENWRVPSRVFRRHAHPPPGSLLFRLEPLEPSNLRGSSKRLGSGGGPLGGAEAGAAPHAPPDHVLALAVYLLRVCALLEAERRPTHPGDVCIAGSESGTRVRGVPLLGAFPGAAVCDNARTIVTSVPPRPPRAAPAPAPAPAPYHADSDTEWEPSEPETTRLPSLTKSVSLPATSTALAVPSPLQMVRREDSVPDDQSDTGGETPQMRALEDVTDRQALALPPLDTMMMDAEPQLTLAIAEPDTPSTHIDEPSDWCVVARRPGPQPSTSAQVQVHNQQPGDESIPVNESIISLLMKLHSQLSGKLDSFSLEETPPENDEPIGDGPYFIGQVLRALAQLDARCGAAIQHVRHTLWPNQRERQAEQRARERREKEERSRRARERQAAVMREFARRQQQFMTHLRANADHMEWDDCLAPERHYDCVICNTTAPATHAMLQSTSVLGHRRRAGSGDARLALSESERARLTAQHDTAAAAHHYRLHDDLHAHFDQQALLAEEIKKTIINFKKDGPSRRTPEHIKRRLESLEKYWNEYRINHEKLSECLPVSEEYFVGDYYQQTRQCYLDAKLYIEKSSISATPQKPPLMGSGDARLALSESERARLTAQHDTAAAAHHYRLHDDLHAHFDQESWLLSVNVGWEGGVHVQSCGHHLHLRCLQLYLRSLAAPQRPHNLHVDRGEFLCPVCRQLANTVLPRPPRLPPSPAAPAAPAASPAAPLADLRRLRGDPAPPPQSPTRLSEAMGKAMEDMSAMAGTKLRQRYGTSPAAIFTFVASLVRTNLECELVQRGGTLVSQPPPRYKPRNDCIVPLMVVAGTHVRALEAAGADFGVADMWTMLVPRDDDAGPGGSGGGGPPVPAPAPSARPVPLLLRDPAALLLQLLLLAPAHPPHLEPQHFTYMVRALYTLTYYQIVCQFIASTDAEGRAALGAGAGDGPRAAARLLLGALAGSELFTEDGPALGRAPPALQLTPHTQELLLPFMRIAALLRHHLYGAVLPDIESPAQEFGQLACFLELIQGGGEQDWDVTQGLLPAHQHAARGWARQLGAAAARGQLVVRRILRGLHVRWAQPALLALPRDYDRLFTYYHERVCTQCGAVPKEASVCLLCGTLVCLKQACCRQHQVAEAVQHAMECGGGTGIFLVVTSTYIIVIRGRRACLWGSLYLDDYDEEDRDLKRGKPLYLSQDRLELLQAQWLAHRFDHTKRTWVWHRDSL
ncbi:hypothetical protein evm_009484 [Chilo suppressalis]|nr:hypothetical protein evm_009484 [Chilo suppressalis]